MSNLSDALSRSRYSGVQSQGHTQTERVMGWPDWIFCRRTKLDQSAACPHLTPLVTFGSKPVYHCMTNSIKEPVCFLGYLEITFVMIWLNNDILIISVTVIKNASYVSWFESHCFSCLFFNRIRVNLLQSVSDKRTKPKIQHGVQIVKDNWNPDRSILAKEEGQATSRNALFLQQSPITR